MNIYIYIHTQIYTHSRHTHEYTNWLSCILISQFRQPSMVTPSSSCWWRILQIKSGHRCQSLQLPDCDGAPCGTSLAASGSRESVVGKCWPTGILATLSLVKIKHIMVILPSIYIYISGQMFLRSHQARKSLHRYPEFTITFWLKALPKVKFGEILKPIKRCEKTIHIYIYMYTYIHMYWELPWPLYLWGHRHHQRLFIKC